MKFKISLALLLFFTFTNADLAGKWPTLDQPPPPVAEWTALIDTSKIPGAPIAKSENSNCQASDDFCDWSCTQCIRPVSDVVMCPDKGDWGISFDDGPTNFTTLLLDYLDTTGDKVTFFVIGSRVVENPEILQRAVKAGHQIGVHTWSHPLLTSQSNEEIIAEIKWTEAAIKQAVGLTPKYMRPPRGNYDDRVRSIATQLGYKIVIWDFDTNDWMIGTDKTFQVPWITGNFTKWVKTPSTTGHISLEHDIYQQSAGEGPKAMEIVKEAGFLIKPVAVCLGDTPYVENVALNATTPPAVPSTIVTIVASPTPTPDQDTIGNTDNASPTIDSNNSPTNEPNKPNDASLSNFNFSFVCLSVGFLMIFKL